jgi:hypothetical protein
MSTQLRQINIRIHFIRANFNFVSLREQKKLNKELITLGAKPLPCGLEANPNYFTVKRTNHVIEGNNWYW